MMCLIGSGTLYIDVLDTLLSVGLWGGVGFPCRLTYILSIRIDDDSIKLGGNPASQLVNI